MSNVQIADVATSAQRTMNDDITNYQWPLIIPALLEMTVPQIRDSILSLPYARRQKVPP
jgi:hypothetical protein